MRVVFLPVGGAPSELGGIGGAVQASCTTGSSFRATISQSDLRVAVVTPVLVITWQ